MQTTVVATGASLTKDHLKSDDVFIVDTRSVIYVWVGSKASPQEKKSGLQVTLKRKSAESWKAVKTNRSTS